MVGARLIIFSSADERRCFTAKATIKRRLCSAQRFVDMGDMLIERLNTLSRPRARVKRSRTTGSVVQIRLGPYVPIPLGTVLLKAVRKLMGGSFSPFLK
jgi:hypothetical protein